MVTALLNSLRALLVLFFLYEGVSKWVGNHMWSVVFARIGFGDWFRYATGTVEIAGALLLVRRATMRLGVTGLSLTMLGALIAHVAALGVGPQTLVVIVLLLTLLLLGRFHRA